MKEKTPREKEIEKNQKANRLWLKKKTPIKEQDLEHPWKNRPKYINKF